MTALTLQRTRTPVRLGQELGRGGEGVVYAIEGSPDRVAKVFTTSPDPRKIAKLRAMVGQADPQLLKVAAWPTDVLIGPVGEACGFVMPRAAARHDIHKLYSPRSRLEVFPSATFEFIVHVATNVARIFALMHDAGIVIGDVNHGNIMVGPDGTAMLIDCDSVQIQSGASRFTCDVGVSLFTPPELQWVALRGVIRTLEHDRFGLATLLFHLLYLGRHPFAGRYLGSGEMPIEKAISEYRFAYGPDQRTSLMERPPGTLELTTMGGEVARAFVQAFGRLEQTGGRPDARLWVTALDDLKENLRKCPTQSVHQFHRELAACPWCTVEERLNVRLFQGTIVAPLPAPAVNLDALWKAIVSVPAPDPDPPLPVARAPFLLRGVPTPSGRRRNVRRLSILALVIILGIIYNAWQSQLLYILIVCSIILPIVIYTIWILYPGKEIKDARRIRDDASSHWKAVHARWEREASRKIFLTEVDALERTKGDLLKLEGEREQRLRTVRDNSRDKQLHKHLASYRIEPGVVRGIGKVRTSTLRDHGIRTAADVIRLRFERLPGIPAHCKENLLQWREACARGFVFNSADPADASALAAIHQDIDARKQKLVQQLTAGPTHLQAHRQRILDARRQLAPELDRTWVEWKTAENALNAL